MADIVGFGQTGVQVALSTQSGFSSSGFNQNYPYFGYNQGWDPTNNPVAMGDVNGDGLADIVGFSNSGTFVGLSTGTSFLPPTCWTSNFAYPQWTRKCRGSSAMSRRRLADLIGFNSQNNGNGAVMVALSSGLPPTASGCGNSFSTAGWARTSCSSAATDRCCSPTSTAMA